MFSLKMLSGTQGWRDRLIRLSGWIAIPPSLHCLLVPLINSDNLSDSVKENRNGDGNAKRNRTCLAEAGI
jgi:hypothetical protein